MSTAPNGLPCGYPNCKQVFERACHRARHWICAGHAPTQKPTAGAVIKRRKSYTFQRKRDLLLELDKLRDEGVHNALSVLSERTGISTSTLEDWHAQRERIFARLKERGMSEMRQYRPSEGYYPDAELKLYGRFVWTRKYLRRRVSKAWLKHNMSNILKSDYGITTAEFRCSSGWSVRFCKRWGITQQCRTNKNKESVVERLPQIRQFHHR